MSDEVDQTEERSERMLAAYIEQIRRRAEVDLPSGVCLNCGDPAVGRFCSVECGADHEHRERVTRRLTARRRG